VRAPAGGAAADGAPEERRRRVSFALVGQAAAVVGLIGGVVGLVFTFVPSLRPGQGAQPTAAVEIADVNDRATLREYLGAEGIATGSLSPQVLRTLGVLTTVHYTATGLNGKELPLVVALTSRDTGVTVCRHTYPLTPRKGVPPTFRAWMPFPSRPRAGESFNLHVTLFPPGGKPPPLDSRDHNGIPGLDGVQLGVAAIPLDIC
jgi:hypothetical protein